jgi:hypothetical protein
MAGSAKSVQAGGGEGSPAVEGVILHASRSRSLPDVYEFELQSINLHDSCPPMPNYYASTSETVRFTISINFIS